MYKLIVLVGMCGSGKSTVSEFLSSKKINNPYKVIHFGEITMNELSKLNMSINEKNERYMREELRRIYGMEAYAKLSIPLIVESLKKSNTVVDGLYSWSEYKILKEKFDNIIIVNVYTNKKLRYYRLKNRKVRPLTNIESEQRDISEIENIEKGGPIAFADYVLVNNGTKEELIANIFSNIIKT